MSSFFDEIAAKLAQLSGVATPEVSRDELNEFNVRDIQAVRVSEGGGGGGGNVPFVGVDPPPSPTDGMLWWDPDDDTPAPGSEFVKVQVTVPFDAANILTTGALIYTPTAGDWFAIGYPSVRTAWDGTTPKATFCLEGHSAEYIQTISDLTVADSAYGGGILGQQTNSIFGGQAGALFFAVDATPLVVIVDDGSHGDPGSSQGSMEVFLLVVPE